MRGKLHYFGKVADDPKGQAELDLWLDQEDDLLTGRTPRARQDGLTLEDLSNQFLHAKRARVATGELQEATWKSYRGSCQRLLTQLGRKRLVQDLRPDDFQNFRAELAKTNGLAGLANQVRHVRMVFGYAYEADLIDRPVKFGPDFAKLAARGIRRLRRLYQPELGAAPAVIYMGVRSPCCHWKNYSRPLRVTS